MLAPCPIAQRGATGARVSPPSAPGAVPSRRGDVRAQDPAAEPPSAFLSGASLGSRLLLASDFFHFLQLLAQHSRAGVADAARVLKRPSRAATKALMALA